MIGWVTSLVRLSLFLIFVDDPDFDGVVCRRGLVLASHPMLLQDIFDKILQNTAIRR